MRNSYLYTAKLFVVLFLCSCKIQVYSYKVKNNSGNIYGRAYDTLTNAVLGPSYPLHKFLLDTSSSRQGLFSIFLLNQNTHQFISAIALPLGSDSILFHIFLKDKQADTIGVSLQINLSRKDIVEQSLLEETLSGVNIRYFPYADTPKAAVTSGYPARSVDFGIINAIGHMVDNSRMQLISGNLSTPTGSFLMTIVNDPEMPSLTLKSAAIISFCSQWQDRCYQYSYKISQARKATCHYHLSYSNFRWLFFKDVSCEVNCDK